jgi:hypothetical protein
MGAETAPPKVAAPAEHAALKTRLAEFFRRSGHVAEAGVEDVVEGTLQVVMAGKFGE